MARRAVAASTRTSPEPGFLEGLSTSWRASADADDGAIEAQRREALDDGFGDLVTTLERQGVAGRFTSRPARSGFALVYDEDAIWRAAMTRPDLVKTLPKSLDDYRAGLIAPVDARVARRADVSARSGVVARTAGALAYGASDPLNVATMGLGGVGSAKTILATGIREAKINLGMELAQQPSRIVERGLHGKRTEATDTAIDLAGAAVGGFAFGAAGKALEGAPARAGAMLGQLRDTLPEAIRRRWPAGAPIPDAVLPDVAEHVIGRTNMTGEELTATSAMRRDAEARANNPFVGNGAGVAADAAHMEAAMGRIMAPAGNAPAPAATPAAPRFDMRAYRNRVGAVEGRGNWDAQSPTSSAYGLFQFTRGTWLRILREQPGNEHLSDDRLWAKRTESAWQEKAFNALTRQNAAVLADAGVPQTAGNMYLLHFAGAGGGRRILKAAPDTPIERVLSADAIAANGFLEGKTAGDVIAWAHTKMNERPSTAPVLRREAFDDGEQWAAAQRQLNEMPPEPEGVRWSDEPAAPESWIDDAPAIEPDAFARGGDWEPDLEPAPSWTSELARMRAGDTDIVEGMIRHPDIPGPIDVRMGVPGDPANDFRGGYGLAHILAKHPEMEAVLDQLPDLIAGMDVKQRRPERMVLESPDHVASVALTWHGEDGRWLVTAYEKPNAPAGPTSVRGPIDGGSGSSRPGAAKEIMADGEQGKAAKLLRDMWATEAARGEKSQPMYVMRPAGGGEMLTWSPSRAVINRAMAEEPGDWEMARLYPPPASGAAPAIVTGGFDHPDDVAAARQLDSLEHDLRMWLADDDAAGAMVRLNDEGDPISAADALADANEDWAVLDRAQACMAPGEGDAA